MFIDLSQASVGVRVTHVQSGLYAQCDSKHLGFNLAKPGQRVVFKIPMSPLNVA